MAQRFSLAPMQQKLAAWHEQRFDWLLDRVASPIAPVHWFAALRPAGTLARLAAAAAKYLLVAIWAVGFLWLWFLALWVLILWDAVLPAGKPAAAPATPHGSNPAKPQE